MNQFQRLELLVNEKINDIYDKNILIIGLGGVGSYAVEALVRSGISNITIVDNDTISITNLNRQLMAYHSNIGCYKTDEIEKRILDINPNAKVIKVTEFIDRNNINDLFKTKYDYVIDACDTLMVKMDLIRMCDKNKTKLISCMGSGNKMDPSRLKITELRKTNYDPLAKKLRKMVKDENIKNKITVICSDEPIKVKKTKEIPSNSFVPATAGLLCASYIINDIVGDKNV